MTLQRGIRRSAANPRTAAQQLCRSGASAGSQVSQPSASQHTENAQYSAASNWIVGYTQVPSQLNPLVCSIRNRPSQPDRFSKMTVRLYNTQLSQLCAQYSAALDKCNFYRYAANPFRLFSSESFRHIPQATPNNIRAMYLTQMM